MAAITTNAFAEPLLKFDLSPGQVKQVTWTTPNTGGNFLNPRGYFPDEQPKIRLVKRVTLKNSGEIALINPVLTINGRTLLGRSDPFGMLGLDAKELTLSALFHAWIEQRIHGTTGLDENDDPATVINSLGVTLCKNDASALAQLVIRAGGAARALRLNGHVANEFSLNGQTAVLDGDQNCYFLNWDNKSLADAATLRSDPLLAIRTRIYGRQTPFQIGHSWLNSARFDLSNADPFKALKLRTSPKNIPNWKLFPGESVTFYPDARRLPHVLQRPKSGSDSSWLQRATIAVAFRLNLSDRRKQGKFISLPLPIIAIEHDDHKKAEVMDPSKVTYEIPIPQQGKSITVWCQAAASQFPNLRERANRVELESVSPRGQATLKFFVSADAAATPSVPRPSVQMIKKANFGIPDFKLSDSRADTIWWQVARSPEFDRSYANFELIQRPVPVLRLASPLETTFFDSQTSYYFRIRQRIDGIWSEWSDTSVFMLTKPDAPKLIEVTPAENGLVRLSWEPIAADIMVFGSNRRDFVPEIFSRIQATRIMSGRIDASTENKNLLVRTNGIKGSVEVPGFAFYRAIAFDKSGMSVPSSLVHLASKDYYTLQNRHNPPDHDVAIPVRFEFPQPIIP